MGKSAIRVSLAEYMRANPPKRPTHCSICDLGPEYVALIGEARKAGYGSQAIYSLLVANEVEVTEPKVRRHIKRAACNGKAAR